MLQSFDATTKPDQGPPRLKALRERLAALKLDAFIVPRADAHQGEYVPPSEARLEWLTGFTGSAGFCVVTAREAGLFVDGRYTLQARSQTAEEFTPVPWPATRPAAWLAERLPAGARLGYDPWLHTVDEVEKLTEALSGAGIGLVALRENPVDAIWQDRPAPPKGQAFRYPEDLAGTPAAEKRQALGAALKSAGHKAAIITLPDSLNWLLNIRGSDLPRLPVALGFGILRDDGSLEVAMDAGKLSDLGGDLGQGVSVIAPDALLSALATMSGPVRLDRRSAPAILAQTLEAGGVALAWGDDPCQGPKARKTPAELKATREAHLRDGAAMAAFLAYVDGIPARLRAGETVTEIDVAQKLESCRQASGALRDLSFDAIVGAGPNGAIVHYRVTHDTNRALALGELLLVDSGGQYLDGTTDITRTMALGDPTAEQVACFTRVLKGMIAIHRARWPKGLAGRDLDALARAPLWAAGQDFDHGTGHGVGVFLSVHEGPQRLSRTSEVPLEPSMILSNEPGYYRQGEFGIRLENLVVVTAQETPPGGDAHREMLGMETLTFAPIDLSLVDAGALTAGERDWLNAYHAEVAARIGPLVSGEVADWLSRATRAI